MISVLSSLPDVLDRLDHAADLVVGVGQVGGIHVDLADEQLLLVGRERVPRLQLVGPWRELGVRRDHAELLLVGEDLLAQLVPALVEQVHVADLLDPLRRRVVRRMRAAGHVVDEEWLLGIDLVEHLHVARWRRRPSPWSGSIPDCRRRDRSPWCCGTGSAATGWCRRRRSRRNTRSPCRSATGRTARPGSPGRPACCGPCRTRRWRSRCPSGSGRWSPRSWR